MTPDGKLVEEGFEYNSETNKEWISINKLREVLKKEGLYDFEKYN